MTISEIESIFLGKHGEILGKCGDIYLCRITPLNSKAYYTVNRLELKQDRANDTFLALYTFI